MTKYAKCSVCGYVVAIYDDTDASDYVCPVDGTTLVVATRTEYMVMEKAAATFIVAASDSLHKERADYVCDGVDDHVEIQAAFDALPATGGEVLLLDGTYTIEVTITMDSYQTLRGCGRNTIITTTTSTLNMITATGGSGTEKAGILIADICIDGQAGSITNNDIGIMWEYVDYSKIVNCWIWNNEEHGIILETCDGNKIEGNWLYNNDENGIYLVTSCYNEISGNWVSTSYQDIYLANASNYNTISGNICVLANDVGIFVYNVSNYNTIVNNIVKGNDYGIEIYTAYHNTVTGNIAEGNAASGIYVYGSDYITINGNVCDGNTNSGIELYSSNQNNITSNNIFKNGKYGIELHTVTHSSIIGNNSQANSQTTDNTYDNISLAVSDDNLLEANICRQGTEVNQPQYGINISTTTCDHNSIIGNDLDDSGQTGNLNDAGTLSIIQSDNRGIAPFQIKQLVYAQNTSGGDLTTGNVVSYEAAASAIGFHSPTAIGDPQVWGMLAQNIANSAFGYIQILGGTVLLDATNAGGGNIAIGNLLCTEVGSRARKAAAGHIAFAIAMEACAAADAIINALIITPRYVP